MNLIKRINYWTCLWAIPLIAAFVVAIWAIWMRPLSGLDASAALYSQAQAMLDEDWAERPGSEHNPRIITALAAVVGKRNPLSQADETAWCAAALAHAMRASQLRPKRSLRARDYLNWGREVSLDEVVPGDIVIFWRVSPESWQGHVGVFSHFDRNGNLVMIGGNQRGDWRELTYARARVIGARRG
jgi:uncharacterized protein (TIGR02594 family)